MEVIGVSFIQFIALCFLNNYVVGLGWKDIGDKKQVKILNSYLASFGYVGRYTKTPQKIQEGLKKMQAFANLKVTGVLDAPTIAQLQIPRCGLQDPIKSLKRRKRYNHQGTRWKKDLLTWRYDKDSETKQGLHRDTVRRILATAMKRWSDLTNMKFQETTDKNADIIIRFVRYSHGDPYQFDGFGGTLAHAYYPLTNKGLAGDIHFDDDETFVDGIDKYGRDLNWVATHELGHSLGLDHTNVKKAVMFPWYSANENVRFDQDDISGIQTLYGSPVIKPKQTPAPTKPTAAPTKPTAAPTKPNPPRPRTTVPCPRSSITAIWYLSGYKLFVLLTSRQRIYFVKPNGEKRAGPIRARNFFPKNRVPNPIDAAFTITLYGKEHTVIFAGTSFFLYRQFNFITGPHSIHDGRNQLRLKFPRYVQKVEAVFTRHAFGKTYFMSGERYWRYDTTRRQMDSGYPLQTSASWRGMDERVDAAFSGKIDGKTYFISGDQVYLINDRGMSVAYGYPRKIGADIFYCKTP